VAVPVRHRTDIEALNKDAKNGAAPRHLPCGDPVINTVWMLILRMAEIDPFHGSFQP
jgi:hypothetical protein